MRSSVWRPPSCVELRRPAQLLGDRDRVDRLAAAVQRERGLEDRRRARACRSRSTSSRASTAAVIASRLSIIAPSSDSSASRLCGGIRPAAARTTVTARSLRPGDADLGRLSSDWTNLNPARLLRSANCGSAGVDTTTPVGTKEATTAVTLLWTTALGLSTTLGIVHGWVRQSTRMRAAARVVRVHRPVDDTAVDEPVDGRARRRESGRRAISRRRPRRGGSPTTSGCSRTWSVDAAELLQRLVERRSCAGRSRRRSASAPPRRCRPTSPNRTAGLPRRRAP